jgi:hypothetical protein
LSLLHKILIIGISIKDHANCQTKIVNLDAGQSDRAPTKATMVARAVNVKSHSSIHRLGYARAGTYRTFVLLVGSPS